MTGALALSSCIWSHHGDSRSEDPPAPVPDESPAAFAPQEGQLCSGSWCWEFPYPQGSDLSAVWVFDEEDVWASGSNATVMHWDGKAWSYRGPLTPGSTNASFGGMWASGPNDLWLWGQAGMYRWDGATWHAMEPDPTLDVADLHGSSATNVWAIGDDGIVAHWDGRAWSVDRLDAGGLVSVWTEGTETWVTAVETLGFEDQRGVLWHHDGSTWARQASDAVYGRLWGTGKGDVYALTGSSIARWDGALFVAWDVPFAAALLWGTSATDLWAFDGYLNRVQHYDGSTWTARDLPEHVVPSDVSGTDAGDVWAVGAYGRITRWDGAAWNVLAGAPAEAVLPDGPVRGVREHEVWSSGANGYGLVRWDGARWNEEQTSGHYYGAGGSEPGTICFIGSALECRDGDAQITAASTPAELYSVWASSLRDVWAVGVGVYHHDGKTWTRASEPSDPGIVMRAVWGLSASDVWAVGENGTILHFDGSTWAVEDSGVTGALYAVWGSSASDVWAAGTRYENSVYEVILVHWDGERWSEQPSPGEGVTEGLWGTHAANLWLAVRTTGLAGGGVSRLLHWDGRTWQPDVVPSQNVFGGISGWSNGSLDVTSNHGLLRFYPTAP